MRLFVAINFDDATRQRLLAVQGRLRAAAEYASFSRPENLHLTLSFLGETPPARLPAIRAAMDKTSFVPFALVFDRLGRFRSGSGEIWWCGIAESRALFTVQAALVHNLATAGFPPENRRFAAHITLAREAVGAADLNALFGEPFSCTAGHISLMNSERIAGRLTYTELYGKDAG